MNSKIQDFVKAQNEVDTLQCNQIFKEVAHKYRNDFPGLIEKSNYNLIYNFLKSETFIIESTNGLDFNFTALSNYSHHEIIQLIKQCETFTECDESIVHSLKIAGLNLNRVAERDSFVRAQIFNNEKLGVKELLFISNYLKLQPNNPFFISAFRTITHKADQKFLKNFLIKSSYMKFNRFTDEYTTFNPTKLSHLPKGLADTLLMNAGLFKKNK